MVVPEVEFRRPFRILFWGHISAPEQDIFRKFGEYMSAVQKLQMRFLRRFYLGGTSGTAAMCRIYNIGLP